MTTPDLDTLVESARIAAAQQRSTDAASAEVLKLLARADGSMPLDGLIAAGAPRDVIAHLVVDDPTDKRRKQKARLGFVGEAAVVWLTATGWQATGRATGREVIPTADGIAHAIAPAQISRWLDYRRDALATQGVAVRCVYGAACRRWSGEVTAKAWAALRTSGDPGGEIGGLTGGLIPDALLVERFPPGAEGRALHARAWRLPNEDLDEDDLAESTYAVEVEDTRKAGEPLRSKVERWDAACERLNAVRAVLWIVRTRSVADRLRELGVDSARRTAQLLVPALSVGMDGAEIGPIQRPWYVTQIQDTDPAGERKTTDGRF